MTTRVGATKKQKGQILNTVVEITRWNRDHARQNSYAGYSKPRTAQATIAVLDHGGQRTRFCCSDWTRHVTLDTLPRAFIL